MPTVLRFRRIVGKRVFIFVFSLRLPLSFKCPLFCFFGRKSSAPKKRFDIVFVCLKKGHFCHIISSDCARLYCWGRVAFQRSVLILFFF